MSQDPKKLISDVKRYFDQNVHDTKNLLNYLVLWLDMPGIENRKDEVRRLLLEVQQTYLAKISELRTDFEQFLSVATHSAKAVEFESLASWLSPYLDNYWARCDNPGKLIQNLEQDVSLVYPQSYLSSIISSLLDNAVQYRAKDRELVVEVTLSRATDSVLLRIEDNGNGIDLDRHRSALFQPFQRFSNEGEGKGLSLHLIKTMVEKNGGRIELESWVGEGTTVTVHLKNYK